MAKEEATLLLRIKTAGNKAVGGLSKLFSRFVFTAGDVANAVIAIGKAFLKLAEDAGAAEGVAQAFRNLANSQGKDADVMLANMKKLSAGTVSELELMKQANQAILLGLPVDRFGDMLGIAKSASKATGQSMQFMLNSIVTGLGRGSKLMLDNLGIVFKIEDANKEYAASLGRVASSLTEAERKQAFINKALAVGQANAEAAGASNETFAEVLDRLKASFGDLLIIIGTALLPLFRQLASELQTGIDILNEYAENQDTAGKSSSELKASITELRFQLRELNKEQEKGSKIVGGGFLGAEINKDNEVAKRALESRLVFLTAALKKERKEEGRIEDAKEEQRAEKREEAKLALQEAQLLKDEERIIQSENELALIGADENKKLDLQIKRIDKQLKNETDFNKKKMLLQQKQTLVDDKVNLAKKDKQKKDDEEKLALQKSAFSRVATLSSSSNKTLSAIGKAAALTNIAIAAPEGISNAMKPFAPPLSFVMGAAAAVAFAAQAASVAGVALADGGIIPSSVGGTQATIGEGGRDEAVIPLDDGLGGLGGGITINVNGGLLGDESSAREFAVAIDEELLKLRQSNSSVAFDEDVI